MKVHSWTRLGLKNYTWMFLGWACLSSSLAQLHLFLSLQRLGVGGNNRIFWNQQNNYGCLRWAGDLDGNIKYLCYLTAISPKFAPLKLKDLSKFWEPYLLIISYTTLFKVLEQVQINPQPLCNFTPVVFYWTGLYFEVDYEGNAEFSFAAFHFVVVTVIFILLELFGIGSSLKWMHPFPPLQIYRTNSGDHRSSKICHFPERKSGSPTRN